MARVARVIAEGYPHHITHRGNNHQGIFSDEQDRKKYLALIKTYSKKYQVDILSYCLMPNHVHFIAIPHNVESLAKTFNCVQMIYAQYYNEKQGMCGHLWQGRFYSCVMNEQHLYACARYIERNPVRAKLVGDAKMYQWSSARVHCGIEQEDVLGVQKLFDYIEDGIVNWKEFIQEEDNQQEMTRIKECTNKGLPVGDDGFVREIETKLSRTLRTASPGRPKKIGTATNFLE